MTLRDELAARLKTFRFIDKRGMLFSTKEIAGVWQLELLNAIMPLMEANIRKLRKEDAEAAQQDLDDTRERHKADSLAAACAVCGFPLADTRDEGCRPGDCSMRPLPPPINPQRAISEYGSSAPAWWADIKRERPNRAREIARLTAERAKS
jgi:hypothetical protein